LCAKQLDPILFIMYVIWGEVDKIEALLKVQGSTKQVEKIEVLLKVQGSTKRVHKIDLLTKSKLTKPGPK